MTQMQVLVVGGGPAGSAAAITCAQAGLAVLLVERETFPRPHPGETLHPGVEPILEQLGVAEAVNRAGFLRHPGIRVVVRGRNRFDPYGSDPDGTPWLGYQADRARFDALLLEQARLLGATVLQPCSAGEVRERGGRIVAVATSRGWVQPDFVIDASGPRAWLARACVLNLELHSPRLLAQYGYAQGEITPGLPAPVFRAYEGGWLWMAPLGESRYAWTRLTFPGPAFDRRWRPPLLAGLRPLEPSGATDVSWRCATRPAASNYYLVGDAAAILDPASSHGVLRALLTGIYAGRRVASVLREGVAAATAAVDYARWLRRWFRHDAARLAAFYGGQRAE
jgi:flavin-dependent dehydrogenase